MPTPRFPGWNATKPRFVGFRPREIASAPATHHFAGMQMSPDGRLLAVRDASGGIQVHELPSGREVGRWRLEHPVRAFAFNGAGDTRTPTLIHLVCLWLWEIPLAWALAGPLGFGPTGVFIAVSVAFSTLALVSAVLFRRGGWKTGRV